jgi:predicted NAD/FAD-dependent oxidoreductase
VRDALAGIGYQPCISTVALLEGRSRVPEPGGVQYSGQNGTGEPVWWLADNQRKGISPVPALTIHAGPRYSLEHWQDDDAALAADLVRSVQEFVGTPVRATQTDRWRYSMPVSPHPERCLLASAEPPLVFAGDAFGGARVEGAAMSGLAAAEMLLLAISY